MWYAGNGYKEKSFKRPHMLSSQLLLTNENCLRKLELRRSGRAALESSAAVPTGTLAGDGRNSTGA